MLAQDDTGRIVFDRSTIKLATGAAVFSIEHTQYGNMLRVNSSANRLWFLNDLDFVRDKDGLSPESIKLTSEKSTNRGPAVRLFFDTANANSTDTVRVGLVVSTVVDYPEPPYPACDGKSTISGTRWGASDLRRGWNEMLVCSHYVSP